jgi:hypothetical protein
MEVVEEGANFVGGAVDIVSVLVEEAGQTNSTLHAVGFECLETKPFGVRHNQVRPIRRSL